MERAPIGSVFCGTIKICYMNKNTLLVFLSGIGLVVIFSEIRLRKVELALEAERLESKKNSENLIILGEMVMRVLDVKAAKAIEGMENAPWYDDTGSSEWHKIEKIEK